MSYARVSVRPWAVATMLVWFAAPALAATLADVRVQGALVLPEELYRTVLEIPPEVAPSSALASVLAHNLEQFLRRSGYELAWVEGHVDGEVMVLTVHEGMLEKIVFHGQLTFNLVRFRVALDVPHHVFNRPSLERQIADLSRRFALAEPPTWRLLPSRKLQHEGPQLSETKDLLVGGQSLVVPQQERELHLYFPQPDWPRGWGLDVRSGYFDGFELGPNFQTANLLAKGDRFRVGMTAGVGVRQDMVQNAFYPYPSRGYAEARWFSPELAPNVRLSVLLQSELLNRQRRDLGLENYWSVGSDVSLNVSAQPLQWLSLSAGLGGQHFLLFGETGRTDEPPREAAPQTRWRAFARAGAEWLIDDADGRWDRRHALSVDGRWWLSSQLTSMGDVRAQYQNVIAWGWHDLVLKLGGRWLAGDVPYAFEEPVGNYLRAVFGDVWTRAVVGGRAEFRFSLTRDVYKVGLFVDTAAYSQLDPTSGARQIHAGTAFGPGFHALVEGMFQVDVNASFGLLSTGRAGVGLFVFVYKIF